jgi:DNA-binding MarR family transcriptional regulator
MHTDWLDPAACPYVVGDDGLARWSALHAGAWLGLLQAYRHLTRELDAQLGTAYGLSLSGLELLGRLATCEEHRMRLSVLAGDTGLSLSRVSRLVDALERRGLVQRQPCPEDARATNAWLTDAGLQLTRKAQAAHIHAVQRCFFDHLDSEELRVLATVFARLVRPAASLPEEERMDQP